VAGESAPEPRRITDRQRNKENELEKRPTERYRKSRMAKNGNGNLKKKKKKTIHSIFLSIFFYERIISNVRCIFDIASVNSIQLLFH
jgi:hypothetical protein